MLPRSAQTFGIFALGFTLSACSKDPPKPDPAKETAGSTPAATTTTAPAASQSVAAKPAAAPAASPSAAPAAMVGAKPPTSPEPEIKEWDATKLDLSLIKNWSGPGCMPRRVREWIRIGCSSGTTQKGTPVSIQVLKGFPSTKYSVMEERNGTTMLVFPATEGLDAEATFTFSGASFRFTASWPAGQPEPKTFGAFEEIAAPSEPSGDSIGDSTGDTAGEAPAAPAPTKLEKAVVTSDPLPELPKVEGSPTAEQWTAAKEVGVKGSDGHGCETKQIGEWFRVVCRSNNNTGKVTAASAIRGFDATQGYLVVGNGAVVLLTKYVKGSDIAIDVTWEKTVGRINLKWPDTAAIPPATRGEIASRL